jgi:hypothetical protein
LFAGTRGDPTRDGWIKEFIKRKWSSGLFWAVRLQRKKTTDFLGGVFLCFQGQKIILIFF